MGPEGKADVMRHLRGLGFNFNRRYPGVLDETTRDGDKGPLDHSFCGNIIDRSLDDHIWFDLPAVRLPLDRSGSILGIAFRGAAVCPFHDRVNVTLRQRTI